MHYQQEAKGNSFTNLQHQFQISVAAISKPTVIPEVCDNLQQVARIYEGKKNSKSF